MDKKNPTFMYSIALPLTQPQLSHPCPFPPFALISRPCCSRSNAVTVAAIELAICRTMLCTRGLIPVPSPLARSADASTSERNPTAQRFFARGGLSSPALVRPPVGYLPRIWPRPPMAARSATGAPEAAAGDHPMTLQSYMRSVGGDEQLEAVILHIEGACERIAAVLASPAALPPTPDEEQSIRADPTRDVPKPLDIVSNNILKEALQNSGEVSALASEEDDEAVWCGDGPFVVVFDPLDGSRNIDASIPTGTIFGIYKSLGEVNGLSTEEKASQSVLQPGSKLVASGYALYSSATMLCLTIGSGTQGFTLDSSIGEFVLTHPNLRIPKRGQIYSVNDARYFDWPMGLRRYIDDIRQGKGQHPKKYSARYICSLVADLHRTLIYGGIAMNPRSHLRLVYEANPLSFLVEQAGGKGSDGRQRILDIQPQKLHERLPLFLGSPDDVDELESYKDVRQEVNPGYNV